MESDNRTIKLYLIDGAPKGIRKLQLDNWDGLCFAFPRDMLTMVQARWGYDRNQLLNGPGLYLLIGPDQDNPDIKRVYCGQAAKIIERLNRHDALNTKAFWRDTLILTSSSGNLSISHIKYLERLLILDLRSNSFNDQEFVLDNIIVPREVPITEEDKSISEAYYIQAKVLLPLAEVDLLKPRAYLRPQPCESEHESVEFIITLPRGNVAATGRYQRGAMLVRKESSIDSTPVESMSQGYKILRRRLIDEGTVDPELFTFISDYTFDSPSAAACVIAGSSVSGNQVWKLSSDPTVTLGEWLRQQEQTEIDSVMDAGGEEVGSQDTNSDE